MPQRLPPILSAHTAKKLLDGKNEVSLDMGLTTTKIKRTKNAIMFPSGENIDYGSLEKIAEKENSAYFVSDENVYQVATSGKHFYKLVPTPGAPTLEIDGIRMHRTKDTTPDVDAREKLSILGLDGGYVLDTCMGLGYTAAEARRKGAEKVVTVELEPSVVHISTLGRGTSSRIRTYTRYSGTASPWSSACLTASSTTSSTIRPATATREGSTGASSIIDYSTF